jgi:hypothetical protein
MRCQLIEACAVAEELAQRRFHLGSNPQQFRNVGALAAFFGLKQVGKHLLKTNLIDL